MAERLQKLLADAGLGSRRAIEEWIRAGRLAVNGRPAKLGDRAARGDTITLDGRVVTLPGAATGTAALLIYHKPVGEVTTRSDPQGRRTVFERLPPAPAGRWIVVGRLDATTSGLLLFTNDGALAHGLMHPSGEVEREYLVRVRGHPDASTLARLQHGIDIGDGLARFERIEPQGRSGSHGWYRVTLREGRNREVRRLWRSAGFEVSRLMRLRYGPVELPPELPAGQWRLADQATLEALRQALAAGPRRLATRPGRG